MVFRTSWIDTGLREAVRPMISGGDIPIEGRRVRWPRPFIRHVVPLAFRGLLPEQTCRSVKQRWRPGGLISNRMV